MTLGNYNRYGSGDSLCSQRSSDLSVDEEREHFRRDTERQALFQLERARTKPVAFAVKTNCAFDGTIDDDSPVQGAAVSFSMGDNLHVMERYDQNWWIGRKVQVGCDVGFIPSPAKLEVLRNLIAQSRNAKAYTASKIGNLTPAAAAAAKEKAARVAKFLPIGNKETPKAAPKPRGEEELDGEGGQTAELDAPDPLPGSSLIEQEQKKKKGLLGNKKVEVIPPYDVVPSMRPIVIIGPSLKGYDVTDMMQQALFENLRRKYRNRLIIARVSADLSLAKKTASSGQQAAAAATAAAQGSGSAGQQGQQQQQPKRSIMGGSSANRNVNKAEVQMEVERIFEMAKTLQLVVLDCDTINHPSQLIKTSLNPILVYLQISSPKVLQRLIKSRGKTQTRNMNVQMVAAEKLAQCPLEMWDIVLHENNLEEASEHLIGWLDEYWQATHPPTRPVVPLASHLGAPLQRMLPSLTAPFAAVATAGVGGGGGLQAQSAIGNNNTTSLPRGPSPHGSVTSPSSGNGGGGGRTKSPKPLSLTAGPPVQLHQAGPVLDRATVKPLAISSGKMGVETAAVAVESGAKTPVAPGRMRRSISQGWGQQQANDREFEQMRNRYDEDF